MSDTESAAGPLYPALAAGGQRSRAWEAAVEKVDLRAACCAACGVEVQEAQPCMWLHGVLSQAECTALLGASVKYHTDQTQTDGDYTQPGLRSQFTSVDPELSALLFERVKAFLPSELDGGVLVGLKTVIAHARYYPGQVGFPHMDYRHAGDAGSAVPGAAVASRISFTLYLNDDYTGGELSFVSELRMDGTAGGEHSKVRPRAGSAVLFYQGVPTFAHMPHRITSGCKSILRADVLYAFPDAEAADVGCRNV
eukprot:TRINITY_DN2204_c0_g1_i1.p1 TRINITY_DN2204_c0_g1~~TRINITY_DN2204_c0_g1_i1.p1  ORF type:complete len:253 (+),score=66.32 TRINITY_DN2204_c0_g1_i1:76-834(+)